MRRDEMLAMEPGRELDALIAEKVMNFKIESPSAEQCTIWDGREVRYFEPSTDIAAAWEVVDRMREEAPPNRECFKKLMGGFSIFLIRPVNICKAALLSSGSGEDAV